MNVTIFPSLTKTKNPSYSNVLDVLEKIKSGGTLKSFLESLSTLSGDEYKEKKSELPVICFGGKFGNRSKEGILEGSGLLILDFDQGTEGELKAIRSDLESQNYTYATFSSPKRNGRFKAIIHIPVTKSDEEYKKYFAALQKRYKTVDKSGKDICRACFFTYDPNIYINKDAEVWTEKYETPKQKQSQERYKVKDWGSVNTALRKIEDSVDGEKHNVRTKIGYLFGGWIAQGDIEYDQAIDLLRGAVSKNTSDLASAMDTIEDCVNAGMEKPLPLNDQKKTLEMRVGIGRKYKQLTEVWDEFMEFHKNGYRRGDSLGWTCADEYYSVLEGGTTYISGSPYSGKSQFWHNVLVNIAVEKERKSEEFYALLLSPETGDIPQIYGELTSIYAGMSFVGNYKMDEKTLIEAADFVSRHFMVMDFEGEDANIRDVFVQVEAAEREFNVKFNSVTIDPLNYLSVDESKVSRRDVAIGKDLDFLLADARKNKRHNCIITHVKDQQLIKNSEGQWYYNVPTPRDVAEGQMFFRKGMGMIAVYRPLDSRGEPLIDNEGKPAEENETQIWVQKAKPKGIGKTGMFKLFYDFKKNRYYEKDRMGFNKDPLAKQKERSNFVDSEEREEDDIPF